MMDDTKKIMKVVFLLESAYPDAPETYLKYSNPFEMVIATLLSAHTADACVNTITPKLFEKYPTPHAMMKASIEDLIEIIRPCGTYNRKSEYIQNAARLLVENFGGKVPRTLGELVTLPGVSRKTANVVLSVVFGVNEGVVVDTHVMRVTQKLGFTKQDKNREKVERELMDLLPKHQWYVYSKLIGAHGRQTCIARKPKCTVCAVNGLCPSAKLDA
ncbi:MAG: endonuclease III [Promethearchaeota archaeon]